MSASLRDNSLLKFIPALFARETHLSVLQEIISEFRTQMGETYVQRAQVMHSSSRVCSADTARQREGQREGSDAKIC